MSRLYAVGSRHVFHSRGGYDTDSLMRQQILEQRAWLIVTIWLERSLDLFVH